MRFRSFYPRQSATNKRQYDELIVGMAQLSPIYSDSDKPYIPYRVAEKIFCVAFNARNEARGDISVDAVKAKDGVGVKTFVSGTSNAKYEKVAEFDDRSKYPLSNNIAKRVEQIATYRNDRLRHTVREFDLSSIIYHYLVRDVGKVCIAECPMRPIDIQSMTITTPRGSGGTIAFQDRFNKYKFHSSKSTLFQEFSYQRAYRTLRVRGFMNLTLITKAVRDLSDINTINNTLLSQTDYVILPLYSTRDGEVPAKSGLNQWNAGGRPRDPNEVYIPIPARIHDLKPGFFPPRDHKFTLKTDDGEAFSAKVCQDNSKALMTDPNSDLGKWLLRRKLGLTAGTVATISHLRAKGSDNVIIYKIGTDEYRIETHTFGEYQREYGQEAI